MWWYFKERWIKNSYLESHAVSYKKIKIKVSGQINSKKIYFYHVLINKIIELFRQKEKDPDKNMDTHKNKMNRKI